MKEAVRLKSKGDRHNRIDAIADEVMAALAADYEGRGKEIAGFLNDLEYELVREHILKDGERIDGRDTRTIRPITSEVGFLPRAHGSALFTRGETQALVAATLGTSIDEQRIDSLYGAGKKRFLLHYNFPPFSVGETSSASLRDVARSGTACWRNALSARYLPKHDDFPLHHQDCLRHHRKQRLFFHGSVCGGSLAMMDAGIPIKAPVAGIAMGLIKEGDDVAILSDILGDEDHLGDMDFKVAGTAEGVTALQMDIKITGVTREIMQKALAQAREGRLHILGKMAETSLNLARKCPPMRHASRPSMSRPTRSETSSAPAVKTSAALPRQPALLSISTIPARSILPARHGACEQAIKMIRDLTAEAEEGKLYMGTVRKVMDFGAFVEIFPGTDGLVHISELDTERVKNVTDVLEKEIRFW